MRVCRDEGCIEVRVHRDEGCEEMRGVVMKVCRNEGCGGAGCGDEGMQR